MSNTKKRLAIGFDDIHPQRGYGYCDEYAKRLRALIKYGVRPTLFCTPVWHSRYNIMDSPEWVKKWKGVEWMLHGLTHQNPRLRGDSQHLEYAGMDFENSVKSLSKAKELLQKSTGQKIKGVRFPGWQDPTNVNEVLKKSGLLRHYVHEQGDELPVYETDGIVKVGYTCLLHELPQKVVGDLFVHAHISEGYDGKAMNALNQKNFENLLSFLKKNKDQLEFVTVSELVEEKK